MVTSGPGVVPSTVFPTAPSADDAPDRGLRPTTSGPGLSGSTLPAEATDNLKPLRSFLAWGGHSGDAATFDAFLEIK